MPQESLSRPAIPNNPHNEAKAPICIEHTTAWEVD